MVEDFDGERRFSRSAALAELGVASGVCVMIEGDERPFGVLCVHSAQPRVFNADEVNFLQSTANVLATAIAASAARLRSRSWPPRAAGWWRRRWPPRTGARRGDLRGAARPRPAGPARQPPGPGGGARGPGRATRSGSCARARASSAPCSSCERRSSTSTRSCSSTRDWPRRYARSADHQGRRGGFESDIEVDHARHRRARRADPLARARAADQRREARRGPPRAGPRVPRRGADRARGGGRRPRHGKGPPRAGGAGGPCRPGLERRARGGRLPGASSSTAARSGNRRQGEPAGTADCTPTARTSRPSASDSSANAHSPAVDEILGDRHRHRVSARTRTHLAKNVLDVSADGVRAEVKVARDVLDRQPAGDLLEHLALTFRQRTGAWSVCGRSTSCVPAGAAFPGGRRSATRRAAGLQDESDPSPIGDLPREEAATADFLPEGDSAPPGGDAPSSRWSVPLLSRSFSPTTSVPIATAGACDRPATATSS